MSEKPQTSNQMKPIIVTFEYRRTGMGAISDTIIISFKSGRIIKSKLHTSRSGRHGTRQYALLPARYLAFEVHRSNLGNVYISVKIIQVKENTTIETLNQWELFEGKEQKIQLSDLPKNIVEMLITNKSELPLFYYILDDE